MAQNPNGNFKQRNVRDDHQPNEGKGNIYKLLWQVEGLAAELMRTQAEQGQTQTVSKNHLEPFVVAQPDSAQDFWTFTIDWEIENGLPKRKVVMVGVNEWPRVRENAKEASTLLEQIKNHLKAQIEDLEVELEVN